MLEEYNKVSVMDENCMKLLIKEGTTHSKQGRSLHEMRRINQWYSTYRTQLKAKGMRKEEVIKNWILNDALENG